LADGRGHMARLDEWLRRRMRQVAWKQWKTPRNRRKNLHARGVSEYWAVRAGGASIGPWRMSKSPPVHHALNNTYWHEFGLRSFLKQYQVRHTYLTEPPDADPHVRWCGRGVKAPYPDYESISTYVKCLDRSLIVR